MRALKPKHRIVATILTAAAAIILHGSRAHTVVASSAAPTAKTTVDWPVYGGESAGDRYSALKQINRTNVHQLAVAWKYDTQEVGGLQTNPLIIDRTLYAYSPSQKVIALDAATGKLIWTFNSGIPGPQPARGLTYWTDGRQSILFAGVMYNLYALNPKTGQPITTFGEAGKIDLRKNLGDGDYTKNFAVLTSPGVIYKDLIIVGFRAPETEPAPHGDIRAYDVHTGALRWTFHTIPHPGEFGYETWPKEAWKITGSANNWTGMVVDEKRGILYVPTGSAVDDFYGADRVGNDLFANTLLALDANTGQRIWHFQGVHHDIWDRDFPSPPALVTVKQNGKSIDAIVQTTKQGVVYLFDRTTGKPLFPIVEKSYPATNVPGEVSSPTQPMPLKPEPFARQLLTADMLTTRTPEAHAWAVEQFKTFRSEGQFVPFSVDKQTIIFPGFDGGAEWGGSAVDPRKAILYVNANDIAWTGGLTENKPGGSIGSHLYQTQCAVCHSSDLKGSPPAFPTLIEIDKRITPAAITDDIRNGKGRMPSFPNIQDARLQALLEFLHTGKDSTTSGNETPALKPKSPPDPAGQAAYNKNCALCHGDNMEGAPSNYPSLIGVRDRISDQQILDDIHNGKGRMPALKKISASDNGALLRFLGPRSDIATDKKELESNATPPNGEQRYSFTGYRKFLDPDGYPAIQPPWGTLNAIDLNTGNFLWKIPLGQYPDLVAKGMPNTGSENYGGPIVTAGGLVIISATIYDRKIRAFNSDTGQLLWEASLPFAGVATPATYMIDGKQYIVIATSGQRDRKGPQGAAYVAFALP